MFYLLKNRPINTFCARSTAASCQFSIKRGKGFDRPKGIKKNHLQANIYLHIIILPFPPYLFYNLNVFKYWLLY